MAEANNEKQSASGSFQNWLYRAELGRTTIGSPLVKIISTNPQGKFAGERQLAATVYEIAAVLERASDESGARWAISPEPHEGRITVELSRDGNAKAAETIIEKVLAEMNIPVTTLN